MTSREAGFTLVELLAALAAASLLMGTLSYLTGTFGRQLATPTDQSFARIASVAPLLHSLFEGAIPVRGRAITGDAGHITAIVQPPLAWRSQGLVRAELERTLDKEGVALNLVLTPVNASGRPRQVTPLLRGLRSVAFKVPNPNAVVGLDVLMIDLGPSATETWRLAVRPRIGGSGGCRFDPISMACQQ